MADAVAQAAAVRALAQKIIDSGDLIVKVPYVDMAACMIFVWDYFLTFGLEVEHVWKSKWNVIKVVFLLQRYLPFIDSCYLGLYRELSYHLSLRECKILPFTSGLTSLVGIALSEVLLAFRVYAVWGRNKYIAAGLAIVGLTLIASMLAGMSIYANSIKYFDLSSIGLDRPGCFVTAVGGANTIVLIWSALLAWNTLTMILMLIPGYTVYQTGVRSELWSVLYKDGAYYYVYLCLLSVLNIVFATSLQPALRIVITVLERTLHSVLASRVTLHIRDSATKSRERAAGGGATEVEMQTTKVSFYSPMPF